MFDAGYVCRSQMLQRLLLALLPALFSCSPLAAPPGGRLAALLSSRQVATSQQILGELQHLFRQAASGQEPAAYGAARDQLDQLVSDLDQLASGIPLTNDLQTSASAPSASSPSSMTTRRTVNMPIIDPGGNVFGLVRNEQLFVGSVAVSRRHFIVCGRNIASTFQ